ncbi:MAG: glycogen debranching protein [Acidobacteria bacterium OLB17]|nr:MAG: glycogen debranching protein [Acidobacteria bacterium OLB17]MCZ2390344.1 glycogen debranching enzyme N-terminal domain-containing protein [Acidobacteriota bacterium]
MLSVPRSSCTDLPQAERLEWLEANGIGGYASGTVAGMRSRRYHGLLVAATKPPLGRAVLLSGFEEKLVIGGRIYPLSAARYENAVAPEGWKYLKEFRLDPYPIWTFSFDGIEAERRLFMPHGENTTVMSWALSEANAEARLELTPLLAFRDHHHLRHEDARFPHEYTADIGRVEFASFDGFPPLHIACNAVELEKLGVWYRDLAYTIERERGFDFTEDVFAPCVFRFGLEKPAVVIASTEEHRFEDAAMLEAAEVERRRKVVAAAKPIDETDAIIAAAADQMIVARGTGKTVIAGYHWFDDWGRDTMIALPGLAIANGRPEIAKEILLEYFNYISQGMLPNRFTSGSETPDYNTVDGTLWFFEAIRAYADAADDHDLIRGDLFLKLVNVIRWHLEGTRFGIRVEDDGLLAAGVPGENLTWMDAKIGDRVITPRMGKAVEIQALWYNALRVMEAFADRFDEARLRTRFADLAARAKASFTEKFWNADAACLYDVIDGDTCDASVRPNQIFAVSLHYPILEGERAKAVVEKVERELLTTKGLRTLAPDDPKYVGHYDGGPVERDSAYHQGTVWAWLIGHFIDAYLRVNAADPQVTAKAAAMLAGLELHLHDTMLGSLSEIFDADAPHSAKGAAAQAWSIGEFARIRRKLRS